MGFSRNNLELVLLTWIGAVFTTHQQGSLNVDPAHITLFPQCPHLSIGTVFLIQ